MVRTPVILPAVLPWILSAVAAQSSGAAVKRLDYDATESRLLFASVDRSRDDRLDIFEAGAGLAAVQDHRARQDFERIDGNRDGYIDFSEFDSLFRRVVEHREQFQVRPFYPLPKVTIAEQASPAQQLVASYDKNGNSALDREEILGLLAPFGAANLVDRLRDLDADGSGDLDSAEIDQLLTIMPALSGRAATRRMGSLPADHDGDGVVDQAELGRALRLLDPALVRWAPRILANADRNKDKSLSPEELGLGLPPTAAANKSPAATATPSNKRR